MISTLVCVYFVLHLRTLSYNMGPHTHTAPAYKKKVVHGKGCHHGHIHMDDEKNGINAGQYTLEQCADMTAV